MDLKWLRDKMLAEMKVDEYSEVLGFLSNPSDCLSSDTREYIGGLGYSDFEYVISDMYKNDQTKYKNTILWGQVVVWEYVLKAYESLNSIAKIVESINVTCYENNYLKSCEEVRRILNIYAEAKATITQLENNLGVDRYLDDVGAEEFDILVELFDKIHRKVDDLLNEYKTLFTIKWHNGNICELMLHQLVRPNMDNQVCSLIKPKKKVFLFIIDGWGMGQYLWSQRTVPQNRNFAYSENIFEWMASHGTASEYILGAPLVSDTAAGLCQIFTGKTAKKTRVFSSTVKKSTGPNFVNVKGEKDVSFAEIANKDSDSFTVDVASNSDKMKIYYCSKYDNENVSGFSKYIFDSAEIVSVTPSERVFSYLASEIENDSTGAIVTYITSIDNSGHVMGSFSQFERYEHEKINLMMKNFLIDMAKKHPETFDGTTSILITADHGMTESYRISISRKDVMNTIHAAGYHADRLIEANRALFIYGVTNGGIADCKKALTKYMSSLNVEALVISKGDSLFDSYFPDYDSIYIDTTPDIAILLISEGIFYSKEMDGNLMHFGGHGGHSVDEVFVPAINIELNETLLRKIDERFLRQFL